MKVLLVLSLVLPLVGCATQAMRRVHAISAEIIAGKAEAKACWSSIVNNPRYASFVVHYPMDISDVTLLQLSDDAYLDQDKIQTFSSMYGEVTQCRKKITLHLANTIPGAVNFYMEEQSAMDNAALDLIERKRTWGDFNKSRKAAYEAMMPKIREAVRAEGLELQAENAAEIERRRQAGAAFARALKDAGQYYQNQQLINALNRPVVLTTPTVNTSCISNGNVTNCTSR